MDRSPPNPSRIQNSDSARRLALRRAAAAVVLAVLASACGADGPGGEPSPQAEEALAEPESPVVDEAAEGAPESVEGSPEDASAEPSTSEPAVEEPAFGEREPREPDAGEAAVEKTEPAAGAGEDTAPVQEVASVRFVSQNILHGVGCRRRTAIHAGWASGYRCSWDSSHRPDARSWCRFRRPTSGSSGLVSGETGACGYEVVWDGDPGLDREVVLTTLEVIGSRRRVLADRFRSAYLVRVDSPIGVIDFLTTHLASGEDRACNPGLCPPPCDPTGSLRTCQARQALEFAEEVAVDGGVTVAGGDLNDSAGSPRVGGVRRGGIR